MVDFNKLRLQRQERLHTMATPTKPRFTAETEEDTTHADTTNDTPKGFSADDLPPDEEESSGMSLDDFEAMTFGSDKRGEIENTIKLMNPPQGDWEKVDRWEFGGKQINAKDKLPSDFDSAGRTILVFKGQPKPRTENGISYQPNFSLRMSPDFRPKTDYDTKEIVPGKPDAMHAMFIAAWEVYTALKGEVPSSPRDLIRFMCEDDYIVRTMKGDNGLILTGLKPPASFKRKRG